MGCPPFKTDLRGESYKILTGKVDMKPDIWFTPIGRTVVAVNSRANLCHLNLATKEAISETGQNQFQLLWLQLGMLYLNQLKNTCNEHRANLLEDK